MLERLPFEMAEVFVEAFWSLTYYVLSGLFVCFAAIIGVKVLYWLAVVVYFILNLVRLPISDHNYRAKNFMQKFAYDIYEADYYE